jgi:hypothetical protein
VARRGLDDSRQPTQLVRPLERRSPRPPGPETAGAAPVGACSELLAPSSVRRVLPRSAARMVAPMRCNVCPASFLATKHRLAFCGRKGASGHWRATLIPGATLRAMGCSWSVSAVRLQRPSQGRPARERLDVQGSQPALLSSSRLPRGPLAMPATQLHVLGLSTPIPSTPRHLEVDPSLASSALAAPRLSVLT